MSGTDWSMPALLDTTNGVAELHHRASVHLEPSTPFSWQANMAQNAAQVMYYLNKFHDHLEGAPYGFTAAAGQLRARGRRPGHRQHDRRRQHQARAPRPATTSTTPT